MGGFFIKNMRFVFSMMATLYRPKKNNFTSQTPNLEVLSTSIILMALTKF